MTPEQLAGMIGEGESFTVEFKGEERARLSDTELVEAVVCLTNGDGGTLLVGVEDDGRVTGARPRHEGLTVPERVMALVANRTQPAVRVQVQPLELEGSEVLVISVPLASRPVGTADGRYVRRAIGGDARPACVPFHAVEMLSAQIDRGTTDYAALDVPEASWEDLDRLEIERFRALAARSGARGDQALVGLSDFDLVRALGVANGRASEPALKAGALLLFGRPESLARYVPSHEVAFQVLAGTAVTVNEIGRSPLIRAAEDLFARFAARNPEEEVHTGLFRMSVPGYPEESFREAVANALVHRDFTRLGAVHVQWQADRIEISNPGGLPPGISVDNLLSAPPRPRNPLLADAFKRAGLVERTGRGVNRIFEGQARYGRRLPDYGRTTRTDVVVVIPGGQPNAAMVRFVAEQAAAQRPLSLAALLVINELTRERRLATAQVAHLLQTTEAEARASLAGMVEAGYVEARGDGKGRTWHLSAGAYRGMGGEAGYVRTKGFDTLQSEQMVLSYVKAHGRITRAQAAELCQLAPAQATRLLRRLVQRGELRLVGERRAARYERES